MDDRDKPGHDGEGRVNAKAAPDAVSAFGAAVKAKLHNAAEVEKWKIGSA